MIFFALIALIGMYFLTPFRVSTQFSKKYNGSDQRPKTDNDTQLYEIKVIMDKYDLLKVLQDNNIIEQEKLRLIYASHFLDEINPYIIKPPNLTKGLKW
jgi:hypothetical protein